MFEDKDNPAAQPFLDGTHCHNEEEESHDSFGEPRDKASLGLRFRIKQSFWSSWVYFLSHAIILVTYSAAFVYFASKNHRVDQRAPEIIPLPARRALQWETRRFPTLITNNPLAGEPRPELEEAWHNLLRNDNIRVANTDLEALNLTSVYLKDGSGAIASLGVYHALHCLKKIRHMAYRDRYHKGKDELQLLREQKHVDHCIEYIRESLMCKPDLSLVTFYWINETAQHADPSARYPTQNDDCLHECANWESISAWAGERVFDLYRTDLLRKPTHGLHYEKEP